MMVEGGNACTVHTALSDLYYSMISCIGLSIQPKQIVQS